MFARRSVPLWVVIIAGGLVFGGLAVCRDEVTHAVHDASLWTDYHGRPLDWPGEIIGCPHCGGHCRCMTGYDYRCDGCGLRASIRWIAAEGLCRIDSLLHDRKPGSPRAR
jgi:hypothetical protein